MKATPIAGALLAAVVAAACQSPTAIDPVEARSANKVELQVDDHGAITEVEYHVDPDVIPASVREAMDRLHPGGPYTDAEREINGGKLYYELSRTVDGLEVEAMFTPEGKLWSEEIEVPASALPKAARDAVAFRFPDAPVDKYEEIRDRSRKIVEFHMKLVVDGVRHKLILTPGGTVLGDFLELEAEVEVPAGQP